MGTGTKPTWRLNEDVWLEILSYLDDDMADLCSLSTVHSFFYRLIGKDFKRLCVENFVYRLPGETWADAFSCAYSRTWKGGIGHKYIERFINISRCYDSDRFAFFFQRFVAVVGLDFAKPFCRYIPVDFDIYSATLCDKGNYVAVIGMKSKDVFIYSVSSGRLHMIKKADQPTILFRDCLYSAAENSMFSFPRRKNFALEAGEVLRNACDDGKGCRYIWYTTMSSKLYVLDTNNKKNYFIRDGLDDRYETYISVLSATQSIIVSEAINSTLSIYDIHSGELIFFYVSDFRGSSWTDLSDYLVQNVSSGELIQYKEARGEWKLCDDTVLALGERFDFEAMSLRAYSVSQTDIIVGDYHKSVYCDSILYIYLLEVKKNSVNLKKMDCSIFLKNHLFHELYKRLEKTRDLNDFKMKSADDLMSDSLMQCVRKIPRFAYKNIKTFRRSH